MPLVIDDIFDQIRGRFARVRANRALVSIYKAIDVHPNTLQRFVNGADPSPQVMRKIVSWCDAQEACATKDGPPVLPSTGAPVVTPQP